MGIYSNRYKALSNKIKKARLERGLDQTELANQLGKTQSYISKLEAGQIKVDVEILDILSTLLNKPITYFFENYKDK